MEHLIYLLLLALKFLECCSIKSLVLPSNQSTILVATSFLTRSFSRVFDGYERKTNFIIGKNGYVIYCHLGFSLYKLPH